MSLLNGFYFQLSKWLKTVTAKWLINVDAVWIANKQCQNRGQDEPITKSGSQCKTDAGITQWTTLKVSDLDNWDIFGHFHLGRSGPGAPTLPAAALSESISCCRSCPTPDTTHPWIVRGAAATFAYQLVTERPLECWSRYKSPCVISEVI